MKNENENENFNPTNEEDRIRTYDPYTGMELQSTAITALPPLHQQISRKGVGPKGLEPLKIPL